MKSRIRRRTLVALAALLLAAPLAPAAQAVETDAHVEGTLPSGATYVMDKPESWNGTVLLFSHGYTPLGVPNPARNAPDDATKSALLKEGYALIGSSYASNGWAVSEAVPDQLATLDTFTARFGPARHTIAWGASYGGLVTSMIAERHPDRISGSLSLCGLLQGGVANWNSTLDPVFALKTLLAPGADISLTDLGSQAAAAEAADTLAGAVAGAQSAASGRARIALAAALHNIPGWNDPSQTRPGPTDWDAQQANQFQAVMGLVKFPAFSWRQEAESRVRGNMSWNTGVDYSAMLHRSPLYKEVSELYAKAGLSLSKDLATLNRAPRIAADTKAVDRMALTSSFTGRPAKPQLTVHTTGDGLIPVQSASAYRRAVTAAGATPLLRQAFVENAGHCTFSTGEGVAALHTLETRITTGHWQGTDPATLNARATEADPSGPARYVSYQPAQYPRPYDLSHPADRYRP
ncbi:S9 family peptidase [Streptomyces sp. SA15]|uniref:alpha/beta hydrolase family protein n=1 Tax=Streptomyces sp. SA15 TaxID=934019 RepID=UPI00211CC7C2|nr:S9 family peptidase [Streptomyces sp. SA15]